MGADFAADFVDEGPEPLPPQQLGLRGTVGSGKTREMIGAVRAALKDDPGAVCAWFVPDHELAGEAAGRLRAALPNVPVGVWRGTGQPDPNAPAAAPHAMCQRDDDVRALGEAGGEIAELCGNAKRGFCRFHPKAGGACGYVVQGDQARRVWVMTHAMLPRAAPRALRRRTADADAAPAADLVVIDEAFHKAMLGGGSGRDAYAVALADLNAPIFKTVPDRPGDIAPGYAGARLASALSDLHGVLAAAAVGDRIDPDRLAAAGLDEGSCRAARVYAWRCKQKLPDTLPAAPPGSVSGRLGTLGNDNRRVLRVARLFEIAADVLAERLGPAALQVTEDKAGGRAFVLRWRHEIHPAWLEASRGIIHGDATMRPEIVRQWLPRLSVLDPPPVAAPHMRVVQVEDRAFGYSAVNEKAKANIGEAGQKAAARNAVRVRRVVDELASRYAGRGTGGKDALAVLPQELEAEFRRGAVPLPANVGTLHFGKLRGQDAFRGVAALLVVSRPLPPPRAVEDDAEIIFGRTVARLSEGAFYPVADTVRVMAGGTGRPGKTRRHPDPDAEAVRWAACEAEVIQAVGRGRGIHRTGGDPLDVFVLTNVPLDDVPVSAVCTLDAVWGDLADEDPVRALLKAGVLPASWAGVGAVLAQRGWFEGAAGHGKAAKCRFGRDRAARDALSSVRRRLGSKGAQTSKSISIGGLSPFRVSAPWGRWTYRRQASRRKDSVLVAPEHADPKAAVEAVLGPLAHFALAPDAADRTAQPPPVAAPDPPPENAPVPPPAPDPQDEADPEARLARVPLSLPAVFSELVRAGALRPADRTRHMRRFQTSRGTHDERERQALARVAREIGPAPLAAAARAAAQARLARPA